ncbi:DoxX family protein [Polymorphospora sp. NPDC050346]|uniref:DoxX family protein n=1 Tax=Polymorphospora sp. NPDC050346 TaxID=3155780 RepID=UPI003409340B
MTPVRSAARALLSGIFVVSGIRNLIKPEPLVAKAKPVTDRVTPLIEQVDSRLPTDPRTLVRVNAVAQLAGGLLLATGRCTRPAAAVLAASLVPTTIAGHPFWSVDDPADRRNQQTHFLKNIGLFGGLLLAAVDTQGRPGVGWRARRAVDDGLRSVDRGRRSVGRAVRSARRDARIAVRSASIGRHLPG